MGFFTSKPVKFRRMIRDHNDSRSEFNQLVNTMGRPATKEFLEILYDKWVVGQGWKIDTLPPADVAKAMKRERENFLSRKQYVGSLGPQSKSGALATILNGNIRPLTDYYKTPKGGALAGRDLAIDQAANWICGTYVQALPATRALLEKYIPARAGAGGPMGSALGATSKHIRELFKVAVPDAAKYRLNLQAVKYPSTVGGGILLDYIFTSTAGNTWPAYGNAHWENIAMFYMIAIAHVQGLPDGNKRTAHYAYSILLIKGTGAFKAPLAKKENELFRMTV